MYIADFLTVDRVVLNHRSRDKAQLLSNAGRLIGQPASGLQGDSIETALRAREQLGSTGLGGGFALPHARIEGLTEYLGLFLRLVRPIDFAAIDDKPVDLVFVLLIPPQHEMSHVKALAAISRKFRDTAVVTKLRKADTAASAYEMLTST